ncbi:OmpA family protein [Photobacterium damselae]|uniref:OmpA family protein n=1 Tax=Photobacterium damselae TaxID=38293 RepID=UPI000E02665E|nr:OmpA family protein [Photobacterium damselae]SUB90839.1 Outer membrane protein II [Photobacterium damselae]
MSKLRIVLPFAFLIPCVVHANNNDLWYLGIRVGSTHHSDIFSGINKNVSLLDNDDIGGGLFTGYNITPWFAIETGYTWLGNTELDFNNGDGIKVKNQAIDLVGKFTWHTNDYISIYAKLGGSYIYSKAKYFGTDFKDNNINGTIGAGFEFSLKDNLLARLEYQYYHDIELKDKGYRDNWNSQFYGLSLIYSWGASDYKDISNTPRYVDKVYTNRLKELKFDIPFEFDDATVTSDTVDQMGLILERLKNEDLSKIYITGYTDSIGKGSYNKKLSERRANAVYDSVRNDLLNISDSRIIIKGEGEVKPIASNKTKDGRAKNRRVEIFSPSIDTEVIIQEPIKNDK